jgi:nucleoside-diphosphate-sugar epimerase
VKVLYIGGTGTISSSCVAESARRGHDVHVLNRGRTVEKRPLPEGVTTVTGDVRDPESMRAALAGASYDCVVDFLTYDADDASAAVDLLLGRTGQYIFISTAAMYHKPVRRVPYVESTTRYNPHSAYARGKIAAEDVLHRAYEERDFPVTIVRPSHTYDRTSIPLTGGWTVIDRMRRGKEVVVHGDGTSLWTITHHTDFAKAFVGLLGHPRAIGESFHITSDEALTWNQIVECLASAAGVAEPRIVHVASAAIAAADPAWGDSLLGDKTHSMVFDNSKVRGLVPDYVATIPYAQGAREVIDWFDADPARQEIDEHIDKTIDRLVEAYRPRPL